VLDGEIVDSKTLVAVLWYDRHRPAAIKT
jgi:hypothetical protein